MKLFAEYMNFEVGHSPTTRKRHSFLYNGHALFLAKLLNIPSVRDSEIC